MLSFTLVVLVLLHPGPGLLEFAAPKRVAVERIQIMPRGREDVYLTGFGSRLSERSDRGNPQEGQLPGNGQSVVVFDSPYSFSPCLGRLYSLARLGESDRFGSRRAPPSAKGHSNPSWSVASAPVLRLLSVWALAGGSPLYPRRGTPPSAAEPRRAPPDESAAPARTLGLFPVWARVT
jgi:hypothetical protein